MNGKKPDTDRERLVKFFIPSKVFLLVTSGEKYINLAPVTWVSPFSYKPPAITVALKKESDSAKNIGRIREFCICMPSKKNVQDVHYCAKKVPYGKSELFMTRFRLSRPFYIGKGARIRDLPWMECRARVVQRMPGYDHFLIVADVIHIGGIELGYKDLVLEYGKRSTYRTTFGRLIKVKSY